MKRTTLIVLLISLFVSHAGGQNAPNDEQARALAVDAVATIAGVAKTDLNTKRLEELEDDLFSFQTKIFGQIRKGAYFYRVGEGGWHITSPKEVSHVSGSSQVWYVAISTVNGEAFGLLGFKDADANFRRLMSSTS